MAREVVRRIDGESDLRLVLLAREIALSPRSTTGAERRVAAFLEELTASATPTLAYFAPHVEPAHVNGGTAASAAWRRLPLGLRGLRRDVARILGALAFVARHIRSIRRFEPTVVLERATYLDPSGALIARLLGVPHVLELHGDLAVDADRYYSSPLAPLGRAYERRRYRAADQVVVVSRGLADLLEANGVPPGRISVVSNGVTPAERKPSPASAVREVWDIGTRRVVGWIGHLMPWQLDAFDALAAGLNEVDTRTPLALVVVAPLTKTVREARDRLERGATFPVRFPGEATTSDADDAVAAFDVGIVPSARSYDLPVKLFHYAMLGVAVVAPDTPSIRELDADRELLYFFEEGGAAAAVARALLAPDHEERVARLRSVVSQQHTWPAVVTAVLGVCRAAARN